MSYSNAIVGKLYPDSTSNTICIPYVCIRSPATCTTVEVAGAEGDLSGVYTYDGDNYIRRGGSTSYILGKHTNDQWLLGQGFNIFLADDSYPYYYVSAPGCAQNGDYTNSLVTIPPGGLHSRTCHSSCLGSSLTFGRGFGGHATLVIGCKSNLVQSTDFYSRVCSDRSTFNNQ